MKIVQILKIPKVNEPETPFSYYFRFKVYLLHTQQKSEASCALLSPAFLHQFR